jgi:hypothetical protein
MVSEGADISILRDVICFSIFWDHKVALRKHEVALSFWKKSPNWAQSLARGSTLRSIKRQRRAIEWVQQ